MTISRRGLLFGLPLFLAGCQSMPNQQAMYGDLPDEPHPLKKVPLEKIKPELRRQEVAYETGHPAGTVVVDTPARRLYYILGNGRAMRYGIGVGRNGYALAGNAYVGRKAEWPTWTPTPNMIRRDPEKNLKYAGGLPGGPTIRWARVPCISTGMATTPCSACMAPTSPGRSARPCRLAACA